MTRNASAAGRMLAGVPDSPEAMSLTELADGVYAWLSPRPRNGVSNAGVVVEDDGITVIDTLMVRSQWEPFAAAVKAFDRPVRHTVLTSARIDHVGGSKAFPMSAVYATPHTSDLLDLEMPTDAYRNFMPEFADELGELGEIGTRPATHIVDGAAQFTERIELLPVAGATPGDLLVLIADADICFTGDLCDFGVTPLAFQSDLALWAEVLDAVAELADVFVPGHGRIGGEEQVRDLQRYLGACVAAAGDVAAIGPGPWDSWSERDRDVINVERAAMLAAGDDEVPPSMLRAMGFS